MTKTHPTRANPRARLTDTLYDEYKTTGCKKKKKRHKKRQSV